MPILTAEALKRKLPAMYRVKQEFDAPTLDNIEELVCREMNKERIREVVKPGQRVAIAVGSRGIANLEKVVKTVGLCLKEWGARPFIVPAMGSHGGATAQGQKEVLEGYGINEASMEMPVLSSMDVVEIGRTSQGIPVFIDKIAYHADLIVPVARIKPHTDFKAEIESGLCKMLAIGLGKHVGCSRLHEEGFHRFHEVIPAVAEVVLNNAPIAFGMALVENAYDKTGQITAVPANVFLQEEPQLLKTAKALMPRIMLKDIDVLVVEQIGKDISGAGMDPNITGRTARGLIPGFDGPDIQRIVVLGLTENTHGNACGLGLAEFTVREVVQKIDYTSTYANVLASSNPDVGKIPVVLENEREAIIAAIQCCYGIDRHNPRIVRIKNTLHLEEILVSEALIPEVKENNRLKIMCRDAVRQ